MKKFLLTGVAAAALLGMSSGAHAVVNLATGLTAAKYAKELVVANTTELTGTAVNVTTPLGFGVSNGQTRYIRVDLTNAKLGAAFDAANDITVPTSTAVVSQGGADGGTFVIVQITATANIAQDAVVAIDLGQVGNGAGGLTVVDPNASVSVTYSLYEDAPSAAAGGATGRLSTQTATVATLATGLAYSAVTTTTTVDVSASPVYSKFVAGGAGTSTTVAQIGTVTLQAAAGVLDPATGVDVLYAALVGAGSKLVLAGDDLTTAVTPATASTGLFLGVDGGNCGAAGTAGTARTSSQVEFVINAVPAVAKPLCYTVAANNTAAIAAQSFTVAADLTAAAGSSTADLAAIAAGSFIRNGTVLKAAFADTTGGAGAFSGAYITNLSNLDAPYTVRCLLNSGSVAGTAGQVDANSGARLSLTGSLGCPADGTLRGLEMTFAVPANSVIGSLVRRNDTTGAVGFDKMN